ncbi:DNA polymerase alpha subunit B-like [Schistocerca gregaria]|uniref:DNA polymerase alpha subunit B-like n=1 Tax=Schistocerca gregaria TaxID=7010 RepID=UPI00211F1FC9|nr:DNA polymerase alpha subunit B-like [Schistocerca gregaria]
MQICVQVNLTAESLANQWDAFTIRNPKWAELSTSNLEKLNQYLRRRNSRPNAARDCQTKSNQNTERITLDQDALNYKNDCFVPAEVSSTEQLKSSLDCSASLSQNKESLASLKFLSVDYSQSENFLPDLADLFKILPNSKFGSRSDREEIVWAHSSSKAYQNHKMERAHNTSVPKVEIAPPWNSPVFLKGYEYMYNDFAQSAKFSSARLKEITELIVERNSLEAPIPILSQVTHTPVTACGILVPEEGEKLNERSVCLQSGAVRVKLDLLDIAQCSLFSGQKVVVRGVNPYGIRFIAQAIYTDATPEPRSNDVKSVSLRASGLIIVVAHGPFTSSEDLAYEPLFAILERVKACRPNVLILMGPFVDESHPRIAGGNCPVDFQVIFEHLVRKIGAAVALLDTRVVIVPSCRDVHHCNILPQPAFQIASSGGDTERFVYAPNPSILRINDFDFGIFAEDILSCLYSVGFVKKSAEPETNSSTSLFSHCLQQQSFMPALSSNMCVAVDQYERGCTMPFKPDALILGSAMSPTCQDVQDTLCINTGELCKETNGGTFAIIQVEEMDEANAQAPLAERASVQIVKI